MTFYSLKGAVPLLCQEPGTGPFTPLSWSVAERKAALAFMERV